MSGPQVIARIPRVSRIEDSQPSDSPAGDRLGRLVGTRLSASVLLGGVVVLIAAALSPFLVSRVFRGNSDTDSGKQDMAQRTETPAADSATPPRWSGSSAVSDRRQDGAGPIASPPGNERLPRLPTAASTQTDSPSLNRGPSWSAQASPNTATASPGTIPWQTSPDARRRDSDVDRADAGPPAFQGESGTVYRSPRVGGLVNAMPPGARDPSAAEPPPEYRTATRPRYVDDPRSSMLNDRQMGDPEATMPNPYTSPGAMGAEIPRDGGQLPSYRSNVPPSGYTGRGASNSHDYSYPARIPGTWYEPGYRSRDAASNNEPSYPNRGPAVGPELGYPSRRPSTAFESGPAIGGRPAMGTRPGNPAAADPNWASPQGVSPEGSALPTYPTTSAPAYPATGFSAPQGWPSGNYAVAPGGESAAPSADYEAAQLEGTIEKPTARTPYERTRPSIR
jgi:hypothetical protein